MAAPTGRGVSPNLGVRLPSDVFNTIRAVARLQGTSASALARQCITAVYQGLLDGEELARELQRRHDQLGRGEEA